MRRSTKRSLARIPGIAVGVVGSIVGTPATAPLWIGLGASMSDAGSKMVGYDPDRYSKTESLGRQDDMAGTREERTKSNKLLGFKVQRDTDDAVETGLKFGTYAAQAYSLGAGLAASAGGKAGEGAVKGAVKAGATVNNASGMGAVHQESLRILEMEEKLKKSRKVLELTSNVAKDKAMQETASQAVKVGFGHNLTSSLASAKEFGANVVSKSKTALNTMTAAGESFLKSDMMKKQSGQMLSNLPNKLFGNKDGSVDEPAENSIAESLSGAGTVIENKNRVSEYDTPETERFLGNKAEGPYADITKGGLSSSPLNF